MMLSGAAGAASEGVGDLTEGRTPDLAQMARTGAGHAALATAGPLLNKAGKMAQEAGDWGWRKVTGIPSKAVSREILETGNATVSPASLEALTRPRGPGGGFVPRQVRPSTLDKFAKVVREPKESWGTKILEAPIVRLKLSVAHRSAVKAATATETSKPLNAPSGEPVPSSWSRYNRTWASLAFT